jgi:hypothetical protein
MGRPNLALPPRCFLMFPLSIKSRDYALSRLKLRLQTSPPAVLARSCSGRNVLVTTSSEGPTSSALPTTQMSRTAPRPGSDPHMNLADRHELFVRKDLVLLYFARDMREVAEEVAASSGYGFFFRCCLLLFAQSLPSKLCSS